VWCGGVVVWRLNASRHQAQGYPEKHGRESLVWSSTHPAAVEPGLANVSGTELKLTVGEGRRSQEPSRDPPEALSFKEAGAFLLAPRGRADDQRRGTIALHDHDPRRRRTTPLGGSTASARPRANSARPMREGAVKHSCRLAS
jgi:hypothetical protein